MTHPYPHDDPRRKAIQPLEVLQSLGCTFGLDLDGSLIFETQASITGHSIAELIRRHEAFFALEVDQKSRRERRRFYGGPLDGKRTASSQIKDEVIVRNVSRGRWAVYQVVDWDGRAFYRGMATSKRNGRRGVLVQSARPAEGK